MVRKCFDGCLFYPSTRLADCRSGQVGERLKPPVSKTGMPARASRVRIPPCPFPACVNSGAFLANHGTVIPRPFIVLLAVAALTTCKQQPLAPAGDLIPFQEIASGHLLEGDGWPAPRCGSLPVGTTPLHSVSVPRIRTTRSRGVSVHRDVRCGRSNPATEVNP